MKPEEITEIYPHGDFISALLTYSRKRKSNKKGETRLSILFCCISYFFAIFNSSGLANINIKDVEFKILISCRNQSWSWGATKFLIK